MAALKKSLREFYGEDVTRSTDYGRIVNQAHFGRLVNYLRQGKAVHGGGYDAKDLFIAPMMRSPSQWPAVSRVSTSADRLPIICSGAIFRLL